MSKSRIIFTIDVEPDLHTGKYIGVEKGLAMAEKLFDKYNIKPILFITADLIPKYKNFFIKLKRKGWELSLHGYSHKRFDEMSSKEKENEIKKSIHVFKKYLKIGPKGFRAPQHSIDGKTLDLLEKYNFKYDSSFTPLNLLQLLFFPKKFKIWIKHFLSPRNPYKIRKKLIEIPTSSIFLPFVSLTLRVFPFFILKIYLKIIKILYIKPVFYCHTWDFIEVKNSKTEKLFNHKLFIKRLEKMLELLQNKK